MQWNNARVANSFCASGRGVAFGNASSRFDQMLNQAAGATGQAGLVTDAAAARDRRRRPDHCAQLRRHRQRRARLVHAARPNTGRWLRRASFDGADGANHRYATPLLPYQASPIVVAINMGKVPARDGIILCLTLAALTFAVLAPLNCLWFRMLGLMHG